MGYGNTPLKQNRRYSIMSVRVAGGDLAECECVLCDEKTAMMRVLHRARPALIIRDCVSMIYRGLPETPARAAIGARTSASSWNTGRCRKARPRAFREGQSRNEMGEIGPPFCRFHAYSMPTSHLFPEPPQYAGRDVHMRHGSSASQSAAGGLPEGAVAHSPPLLNIYLIPPRGDLAPESKGGPS